MTLSVLPLSSSLVRPPLGLQVWLYHPHSLTDLLKARIPSVAVEVLRQDWEPRSWFDTYALGVVDAIVLRRDIVMWGDDKPWWYAQTVIPKSSYDNAPDYFNRLERESIRHLIFATDGVKRVRMSYYPVDKHGVEYHWVARHLPVNEPHFWVRFAEYCYQDDAPFYLFEVLFSELRHLS